MRIHPQVIVKNSMPEFVVLPYKEYGDIIELLEDQLDIQAVEEFQQSKKDTIPFEIVQQIAKGKNAIKKLREFRKLSASSLARKVGVSRQYINQLENNINRRKGSAETLKKIAAALNINIDLLV